MRRFVSVCKFMSLFLILLFFYSPPASATIQFVQQATANNQNTQNTTLSVSLSNTAAGNLLVAYVTPLPGQVSSISVADGVNTYSAAASTFVENTGCGNLTEEFFYAANIRGGNVTVTATINVATGMGLTVLEYSGVATTAPLDAQAGTSNTGCPFSGTPTSASLTTTNANDLIVSGATLTAPDTWTAGTGYGLRTGTSGPSGIEDQTVSSTGTYTGTFGLSTNGNWTAAVVAFKAAGSSDSSGPPICGLQNDGVNRFPSDWATRTGPGIGNSYIDSLGTLTGGLGGCAIHQITNNSGGSVSWSHFYGTLTAMSAGDPNFPDRRYVLLTPSDGSSWKVVDLNGTEVVPQAAFSALNMNEWNVPVWDAHNAYVFYYASGNSLYKATITPGGSPPVAGTLLKQFSNYALVLQSAEADLSQDGDHLYLIGFDTLGQSQPSATPGGMHLFVFQLSTLSVNLNPYDTCRPANYNCTGTTYTYSSTDCSTLKLNGQYYDQNEPGCVHKVQLTPDNNLLIQFDPDGSGTQQGLRLWDGSTLHVVQDATSHMDAGYKLDGTTRVFVELNNSTDTPGFGTNPCSDQWNSPMVVLESSLMSADSCLINPLPPYEISYRGGPSNPWVTFSMFDQRTGTSQKSPEWFNNNTNYVAPVLGSGTCEQDNNNQGYWCLYEDEIIQVRIDAGNSNSLIYRLAYAYSRSANIASDFTSVPRASGSRDGKYIVFDSTMNFNATGCGSVPACMDVFWMKVH